MSNAEIIVVEYASEVVSEQAVCPPNHKVSAGEIQVDAL